MPIKAELRQQLRAQRLQLSAQEVASHSHQIINRLRKQLDWYNVTTVHYFEPITALNEVNIAPFIEELAIIGSIELYTTKKIGDDWQIVDRDNQEPAGLPVFDVVLVPMLGFDANLHRIGYGGGYYDRLLGNQPQAQKIGVCFELGKLEQLPVQPHDIPLNLIITEQGILEA